MPADENKAVLERAIEHWNEGNLPGYLELYDPDAVLHGIPGVEPGFESIRGYYEAFWAAFPGSRLTLDDVISEGDEVACRFTLRATHEGEFNGIPPTHKQVVVTGITILRFADGKCVERWNQADFLGLMQQLGVIPAPEPSETQSATVSTPTKEVVMSAQNSAGLARTIYGAFNNGDLERALDHATEDVEVVMVSLGQTLRGREGLGQMMRGWKTAFPDMKIQITNQVADEDGVANEFVARGTHTGPLAGPAGEIPPTGRAVELTVAEVWQVRGGKLASLHNYQDAATLMRQLGLVP